MYILVHIHDKQRYTPKDWVGFEPTTLRVLGMYMQPRQCSSIEQVNT